MNPVKPVAMMAKELPTLAAKESTKAVNKLIDRAITVITTSHDMVQKAAEAALKHYGQFGDARPMDRLVKGLPKSFYVQGLIFWVKANSPIHWTPKGEVKVYAPEDKNFKPLSIQAAVETPWHTMPEAKTSMDRTLEPFSAKRIFTIVHNQERAFDNAIQSDSKRPFDDTYLSVDQTRAFINELKEFMRGWEERAENNHKKAVAAQETITKPKSDRLIKARDVMKAKQEAKVA